MDEAEEDVLAYASFPAEHWQKIWSNNPLERLNKEVKRRTNVVGMASVRDERLGTLRGSARWSIA
jgi:transposase-like protein